ncbi:MAG: UDP-N-acetylglucosamine--N-acetylmuramyl-(pentapeptide) pyrophosphoryl-undecaprenol N-acetylglucosamine transferase [Candidatus Odinarchaeia archaeon]
MEGKRIYFAPNGVALGHAGRCIPIAKEAANRKAKIIFSTYGDAVGFIKRVGFPVLIAPEIKFDETQDGAVAMLDTSLKWPKHIITFLKQLNTEIKYIKSFKPDIILSDSRLSPLFAGKLLNIPRILLLHQIRMLIPHRKELTPFKQKLKHFGEDIIMYDTHLFWRSSDIILAPDFPPPYTIAKQNLNVPKKMLRNVEFIGQIISKRPEELPSKEELRRKLGVDDRPLIYAGIAGTWLEKKKLNEILTEIFLKIPDSYQIILTRGIPSNPDETVYEGENIKIFNWLTDRYPVLKACDLVISRAGHNTIAECLYYGKPSILIPTPAHTEHQGNAKSAKQMGVSEVIQQKDLNYETLINAIKRILEEDEVISHVKKIQRKISRLNAVETVLNKIKYFIDKNA